MKEDIELFSETKYAYGNQIFAFEFKMKSMTSHMHYK